MENSPLKIMIGLLSNLIVFPPTFLLVEIFRRSRQYRSRSEIIKAHIQKAVDRNASE
jgi:hypothetical protein